MNILITGNGFDLAHELKTSYENFIEFYENVRNHDYHQLDEDTLEMETCKELLKKSENDLLFVYFMMLKKNSIQIKNWYALEYHLDNLINGMHWLRENGGIVNRQTSFYKENRLIIDFLSFYLANSSSIQNYKAHFDSFVSELEVSLNIMSRMLQLYLTLVQKECENYGVRLHFFEQIKFDKHLTFNYMNTFKIFYPDNCQEDEIKLFGEKYDIEEEDNESQNTHWIHGRLDMDLVKNDLVFGIGKKIKNFRGELLLEEEGMFYPFQKFFQRIVKRTGILYKNWVKSFNDKYDLFIFGHSCDIPDMDIIGELIESSSSTYLIYYDEDSLKSIVKNIVSSMGQDWTINATSTGKLMFLDVQEADEYLMDY